MTIEDANKILLDALNIVSETKKYQKDLNEGKGNEYVLKYIYSILKLCQDEADTLKKLPVNTDLDLIFVVDKYLKYFGISKKRGNYKLKWTQCQGHFKKKC